MSEREEMMKQGHDRSRKGVFDADSGGNSTFSRLEAEVESNNHRPDWEPVTDSSLTRDDLRRLLNVLLWLRTGNF